MEPVPCTRHPKLEEIVAECPENEEQARLAFQVYIDMSEAKTWYNVELHVNRDLKTAFVSARNSPGKSREIILPISAETEMSQEDIQMYFSSLQVDNKQTSSLTLAVCDTDTSTVYYKLSNTLLPPDPPDVTEDKKRKRHQRMQCRRQHLSNQSEMYRIDREKKHVDNIDGVKAT